MSLALEPLEPEMTQVRGDNVSNHPAFGMVSVNRIHSTGTTLFASDLRHAEIIELEIYEGQMVERDGVQNPARSTRRPITSISLSSAQWATLVCSFGLGEGVPCTLNRIKTGDSVRIPPIKRMESTRQSMDSIVSAGKAELEASAVGVALRLGIKEIGRLAELENKTDE